MSTEKNNPAPKKAVAKKRTAKPDGDSITVRTKRGVVTRRRAGHRFTREPVTLVRDDLSEEQLVALQDDPALIVEDSQGEEE